MAINQGKDGTMLYQHDIMNNVKTIQHPESREFLRKAGVAGPALAEGAIGLNAWSGCAALGRDLTRYDLNVIIYRYENNPIQINSIDDFPLNEICLDFA
jgi:hypothetical protein